MLPFERLRALARYVGDDTTLVLEAADCLAEFTTDPTQLVTVCRRLVAHHPSCGPLWWLCARVLSAPDPETAARAAARELSADRSADRLAALLPFPHDDPIAVVGSSDIVTAALQERPDLDTFAVDLATDNGTSRPLRYGDPRPLEARAAVERAPSHCLIPVCAMSPTIALVPEGAGGLLDRLGKCKLWLVAPTGHLLPESLFSAVRTRTLDAAPGPAVEALELQRADRVAGPRGLERIEQLAARVDCPAVPELLRS